MSARASRALAALALLAASACSWGEPPGPSVDGVSPGAIPRGATAILSVAGRFEPDVAVDFDDPDRSRVCATLRAELRSAGLPPVELQDVQLVSAGELRARLPALDVRADWDVVVVDAAGREGRLPGAFRTEACAEPCDDGESCTAGDGCTGVARCGGAPLPDDSPCDFGCSAGPVVAGTCQGGACVPAPGLCADTLQCDAP